MIVETPDLVLNSLDQQPKENLSKRCLNLYMHMHLNLNFLLTSACTRSGSQATDLINATTLFMYREHKETTLIEILQSWLYKQI
jgi:hypothetical protein